MWQYNIDWIKKNKVRILESYYEQLKLIGEVNLPKVQLSDILSIVDKYKEYLSEYRVECIKYLLETRYNYLVKEGII